MVENRLAGEKYRRGSPRGGVVVVDALGRTVRRLDLGARPAGAGDAVLPARGLAPGVYTVRMDAGARSAAVRVVVVP